MRDKAYEQEINTVQQEMQLVLDDLGNDLGHWSIRDLLAAQRALQVLIESLVGMSRYIYFQKYGVSVSKSRAGIDGLEKQGDLSRKDHDLCMKMIGFRNVLVHDYLDVNRKIIEAIIRKKNYREVVRISQKMLQLL